MTTTNSLFALASVSQRLGADASCVQGGGGNTSLKTPAGMWVKASGLALAAVSVELGFVLVDDHKIKNGLGSCRSDRDYTDLIGSCLISGAGRPSIETGFHALLGTAVLHSHAILANLLCCAIEGEGLARMLFPQALWVPYATPGLSLTQGLANLIKDTTQLVFLQNHGVIVSDTTPEAAWLRHEDCTRTIAGHLGVTSEDILCPRTAGADPDHALFPDQVVYLENDRLRDTTAGKETLQAYAALRHFLPELGLTPHFLPRSEVDTLCQMESEKYRQKVAIS